jgi:L-arabinose isomerase
MADWAELMGVECAVIDENTTIRDFKRDLLLGEVAYR